MDLKFGNILEQKQTLSQRQIQSLEILSMDKCELGEFLQSEYTENPMLDYTGEHWLGSGHTGADGNSPYVREELQGYEDLDDDRRRQEIPAPNPNLVHDSLMSQLSHSGCPDKIWALYSYMVDCLDDSGFFTVPLAEVAEKNGCTLEQVSQSLAVLQELEPYGVFAPDLRCCLLKQLEKAGRKNTLIWCLVDGYLQDVADGKLVRISKELKLSPEQMRRCLEQLSKLNPRPLNAISSAPSAYITPDVILKRQGDSWEAELNDEWLEDYRISDYYFRMMQEADDPQLAAYFQKKLERAQFVLASISQRRQTLLAIANEIIRHQQGYLSGRAYLEPMTMNDIAAALGIHASTVSRAIRGKYLQYPLGTVAMKELFSAPAAKADRDGAVGTMEIKNKIASFISGENRMKPYSDQALVTMLRDSGIQLSRRAVTKYREEMGIKSSFERKQAFYCL